MKAGHKGLGSAAAKGALATFSGQGARIAIQVAGLAVMARLLGPADYGLMAMAMVVVGLGEVFRDFGLSMAVVQAKTITRRQRNNLFWINTAIGVVLTLTVLALAWRVSSFYGDDRLTGLLWLLSLIFLFNGMATQYRAQLNRQMHFKKLAAVEVVAQALGLGCGIAMALLGEGYWALAWQQVIQAISSVVFLVMVSGWVPGSPKRGVKVSHLFGYGSSLLGTQLVVYASRSVDSLIIGSQIGAAALGVYNRAYQFLMLPLNQINAPATRVALPVLSRLNGDSKKYWEFISFGQTVLVHVVVVFFCFCIVNADILIRAGLGDQWGSATKVFQILAVGGCFQVAGYVTYWVFLSKGLTSENLKYSVITRPILIVSVLVGSQWGMVGVAIGYSVGLMLLWPIGVFWVGRYTGLDAFGMLRNGFRPVFSYFSMALVAHFVLVLSGLDKTVLGLLLSAVVGLFVMLVFFMIWPAYRKDLVTILSAKKYFL